MPTRDFHALILAGGRGTRFWPRSRRRRSKQVLEFLGRGSLIQQTVERLRRVVPAENIWVLTNNHLRAEIVRQLPDVPKRQIVAEPAQRNTAPAIGLAARMLSSVNPDAVMGVFPADHFIAKPEAFAKLAKAAYREAERGGIAILGIQPRWAETGYGYIEFPSGKMTPGRLDPVPIVRFREKPDLATAERFVHAGNFGWNAGMFFWRADVLLSELDKHQPATARLLRGLPAFGSRGFAAALAESFPRCENVSIDYAVLEKTTGVLGFAAGDIGWNDVGSFDAVYELMPKDASRNASRGPALLDSASGNYVDAPGKTVALLSVKDLIVVDTPDALLVCDRRQAQRVGDLVKMLEEQKREDLL